MGRKNTASSSVTFARSSAKFVKRSDPIWKRKGSALECRLPSLAVYVRGDADALAQVLINLVSNAEKYSSDMKRIELELELPKTPGDPVNVKVMDRGLGVPQGCEQKIFQEFFRAHDSLSSGIPGSGLGLTLARQLARAHGGDVTYSPRAGRREYLHC